MTQIQAKAQIQHPETLRNGGVEVKGLWEDPEVGIWPDTGSFLKKVQVLIVQAAVSQDLKKITSNNANSYILLNKYQSFQIKTVAFFFKHSERLVQSSIHSIVGQVQLFQLG